MASDPPPDPGRFTPVGYRNTRDLVDGKNIGIVVPDPLRAPYVTWAFHAYAAGQHTLEQLAEELLERGFTMPATVRLPARPVPTQQVHKMLHNRYYLGAVTFGGVEYPGRHEPLVDSETFEMVQTMLASRRVAKVQPRKRPHPREGLHPLRSQVRDYVLQRTRRSVSLVLLPRPAGW